MKHFFTSLLMLCAALGLSAQNFTVSSYQGPVANGTSINCGYIEDDGEYIWNPELVLHTLKDGNYTVSATADVPDMVKFCAITGVCDLVNGTVSHSGYFSAGKNVPLQIDIEKYDPISQPVKLDVIVTDGSETISFTVNFLTTEMGSINSVKVPSGSIRFTGRNLNYSLNSAETFTLYNISGRQVYARVLSATGNVNLGNIPAGVYVYRCGNQTGKVIIK